ncbi:hypothetical protein [Candidatus Hamiltonella endosymbiont of Tuberolachnus salignus]
MKFESRVARYPTILTTIVMQYANSQSQKIHTFSRCKNTLYLLLYG